MGPSNSVSSHLAARLPLPEDKGLRSGAIGDDCGDKAAGPSAGVHGPAEGASSGIPNSARTRPTGWYDAVARRVWPDVHLGLHLIHVIRVRSVHLGTPTYPKCMTAAEEAAVRRELARAEAEA